MMNNKRVFALVCLAAGILLSVYFAAKIGHKRGYREGWRDALESIQADTTQHTDTSSFVNPEPVAVEPAAAIPAGYVQVKAGTIAQLRARIKELEAAALAAPADSSAKPSPIDSIPVEVSVPLERKVYQDSTYRAVVEGYQARLAEIQTFNTTTTITKVVTQTALPELILSPAAIIALDPGGMMAGVGVSADTWTGRWQFSADIGYGIRLQAGAQTPGWYARIVGKYNLFQK